MTKKNTLLCVATLLSFGLLLTACNDENPTILTKNARLTATLTGAGEKPTSTTSTATGNFVGELDMTTRVLSYTVTFQGLTPTGGHLHKVTNADGTGPVDIPFPSLTSPVIAKTAALRQTQADSLLAGLYYANLHTTTYKAGEIRGDVKKQ